MIINDQLNEFDDLLVSHYMLFRIMKIIVSVFISLMSLDYFGNVFGYVALIGEHLVGFILMQFFNNVARSLL